MVESVKKKSQTKQIQANSGMFAADFLLWVGVMFHPSYPFIFGHLSGLYSNF